MHSLLMEPNGMIPITMDMEIILLQHYNPMSARLMLEVQHKTASDALMGMVTDGLMEVIGLLMISSSGLIVMVMVMETITFLMKTRTSSILIKEEMLTQIIQHNGMIPMATDMAIISQTRVGLKLDQVCGQEI